MNQTQEPTTLELIRSKRDAVLKLAKLQIELREAFKRRMEKEDVTMGAAANECSVAWKAVKELLSGERAFGHGSTLKSLAAYAGKPELANAISKCTENLGDRLTGVSLLPAKAIGLAFDVHEVYDTEASDIPMALFASAFGDLQETVSGILAWRLEAMRQLDATVSVKLEEALLSDDLARRLAEAKTAHQTTVDGLVEELKKQATRLFDGPINQRILAETLGMSASTVSYALLGRVTLARLKEMVEGVAKAADDAEKKRRGKADNGPRATPKAKSDRPKTSDNPSMVPAKKLADVVARLRTVYGSEPRLAQDMKMSLDALHNAMNGCMGVAATENVLQRAEKLAAATFPVHPVTTTAPSGRIGYGGQTQHGPDDPALSLAPATTKRMGPNGATSPRPTPPAEQPVADQDLPSQPTEMTDAAANVWPVGRVSADGVPYSLDSSAFKPFDYRPSPDDLRCTVRQIQLVRAALNVLTQISDDGIRAQVRQTLGHEVEELGMTLRVFTDEFPNRMIGLYDAERETMRVLGMDTKPNKKGNR